MARIKITDLPKDKKIGKAEMRRVRGGALFIRVPGTNDHKIDFTAVPLTTGMKIEVLPALRSEPLR